MAAAVCPCLPLPAFEADEGAPAVPERLRAACGEAVAAVLAEDPEIVAVVDPGARSFLHDEDALGTSQDLGLAVGVRLEHGRAAETLTSRLPMALNFGAWLVAAGGLEWAGACLLFGIRDIGSLFYLSYALGQDSFGGLERELWAVVALTVVISVVLHGVMATPAIGYLDRRRAKAELGGRS